MHIFSLFQARSTIRTWRTSRARSIRCAIWPSSPRSCASRTRKTWWSIWTSWRSWWRAVATRRASPNMWVPSSVWLYETCMQHCTARESDLDLARPIVIGISEKTVTNQLLVCPFGGRAGLFLYYNNHFEDQKCTVISWMGTLWNTKNNHNNKIGDGREDIRGGRKGRCSRSIKTQKIFNNCLT